MRESGSTHGADSDRTRESDEVTPAQGITICVFDGDEEGQGLVQVAIVHPSDLGLEADSGAGAAAPSIRVPIGAGAMPGQADHETTVMAAIRRPAGLAGSHGMRQVLLQSLDVQARERCRIGRCVRHSHGKAACGWHSLVHVGAGCCGQGRQHAHDRKLHGSALQVAGVQRSWGRSPKSASAIRAGRLPQRHGMASKRRNSQSLQSRTTQHSSHVSIIRTYPCNKKNQKTRAITILRRTTTTILRAVRVVGNKNKNNKSSYSRVIEESNNTIIFSAISASPA